MQLERSILICPKRSGETPGEQNASMSSLPSSFTPPSEIIWDVSPKKRPRSPVSPILLDIQVSQWHNMEFE